MHSYLIQKVVAARDIRAALRDERKGRIVEISLTSIGKDKSLEPAIGFMYRPQAGDET